MNSVSKERLREMIYCGRQESKRHKETKYFIAQSLEFDADFSGISVEKTWKSRDGLSRRRPDVSAVGRNGVRFAFEAQLTTTFLDVVVGRQEFYSKEGCLLVWILREFDPDYRRATEDDLLFPNNSNIIVVNQTTLAASGAANRFMVQVYYRTISKLGEYGWANALVPFSSLTFDLKGQRVFFSDFESLEMEVLNSLGKIIASAPKDDRKQAAPISAAEAKKLKQQALRTAIFQFYQNSKNIDKFTWEGFRGLLYAQGVYTPGRAADAWVVARTVNALASAQQGRVIGFGLPNLIALANYLHQNERESLRAFLALIDINGHRKFFELSGDQKAWRKKEAILNLDSQQGNKNVRLNQDIRQLVFFLFPQLTEQKSIVIPHR